MSLVTEYSAPGASPRAVLTSLRNQVSGYGCIFGHARSALVSDYFYSPFDDLGRQMATRNRPTIIDNLAGPATWGNDAAITAVDNAWTAIKAAPYSVRSDKVILLAASMGALSVLNWARTHTNNVAAIGLIVPVTDLEDVHANALYTAEINTAYTNEAGYIAGLPTHNPTAFAATLAGLPIRIWYSTNDPSIPVSTVTTFQAAVGPSCSLVSMGAVGHWTLGPATGEIASWVDSVVPA